VIASTITDGTGGDIGSDLELATSIATMMEAVFGMGQGLSYTHVTTREKLEELRRTDPEVRHRVEHILNCGMERASEMVRNSEACVLAVANVLMEREFVTGADVRRIIESRKSKKQEP
jgi:cell division protease FtsH